MDGVGDRLRSRAAELGLSNAEVARRAGLTTTRYGHYVSDYREPDLATLVRICRVLALRPDVLLACEQPDCGPDELGARRDQVAAFAAIMDAGSLDLAIPVLQAIAATPGLRSPVPTGTEGETPLGRVRERRPRSQPARQGRPPPGA